MNLNLDTWLSILRMTMAGGHYIPPVLLSPLAALDRSADVSVPAETNEDASEEARAAHGLTPRESEVLVMVSLGQPNKTIATQLGLSEHTVKLHIHRIIAKLGVTNRTEAAVWFLNQKAAS
ncbi:response regulator transcription factor [Phaeovulum sp.]|uniref:response regulator transcription factor n=1 Tax=Phaeovulum sp. TaxID=2934796 RepID=UPI0039E2EBBB